MNKSRGFTLVELIVGIAIIGILSSMAFPAFQGMVAGMRVRSTAESFNLGLQLARSEAIKQNSRTSFQFSTTGKWTVCASTTNPCPTASIVQIKRSAEASQNVVIAATPDPTLPQTPAPTMATFTGLGRLYTDATSALNNPDGTAEVTTINFSAAATSKIYRVVISSAGSVRLCDPSLPSGNVKAC